MTFEPIQSPTILPVIASDDYEAFRGVLGSHIPDTYDEWLNLFAKWEEINSGNKSGIRCVNVNSAEFSMYLDTTRAIPALRTLDTLLAFAESIANED
jgi:hypothetical protein